jgi:hypothetical protein
MRVPASARKRKTDRSLTSTPPTCPLPFPNWRELKGLAHPRIKTFSSQLSCHAALLTARGHSRLPITGTVSCSKPNGASTVVPKWVVECVIRIQRTCTTRVFAERYVDGDRPSASCQSFQKESRRGGAVQLSFRLACSRRSANCEDATKYREATARCKYSSGR